MSGELNPVDRAMLLGEVETGGLPQLRQRLAALTGELTRATTRVDLALALVESQTNKQRSELQPLGPTVRDATAATKALLASLKRCEEFMEQDVVL